MNPQHCIDTINARLAAKNFCLLDDNQCGLFHLSASNAANDARELAALFDDLRDRVGVDCDDLRSDNPFFALLAVASQAGFLVEETGGGCDALVCNASEGGPHMMITEHDDPSVPSSLSSACVLGFYRDDQSADGLTIQCANVWEAIALAKRAKFNT